MDAPPSRYRVVERGRRLEVIDTRRPGTRSPPADPDGRPSFYRSLPRRTAFDGSAQLITAAFYDDKAPRTIAFDPARATMARWAGIGAALLAVAAVVAVFFAPWLLVAVPLLLDKRARRPVRGAITRWIDTVERETG